MTDLNYETVFNPPKESLEPIDKGFHEFNLAYLGKEIIYDYYKVAVLARDETGAVIGGVHGEMFWDWLHIHTLWVDKAYRGHGVGIRLLKQIEEAALSKGFYGSHLETTDFQALGFYLKQGYEVFGKLVGKPAGSTWFYLKKALTREKELKG